MYRLCDIDVTQLYESCGLGSFLSSNFVVHFLWCHAIFVGSWILLFWVGFFSLDNSPLTVSNPIGQSSVRLCSLGRNWYWSLNLRINSMSIPLFWIDASLFLAIYWFSICRTDPLRLLKEMENAGRIQILLGAIVILLVLVITPAIIGKGTSPSYNLDFMYLLPSIGKSANSNLVTRN